jgi:ATP phosphoribosyltransferase regulatory subunit
MTSYSEILKNDEKAVFDLRKLYSRFGYTQYKMSKFEEYDLYVRNKDFLVSDSIITFTDKDGRLLALKPDVTLSIINNSKDINGVVQKLYYNENVYRVSSSSHAYKEIMQTGLECIGDIGDFEMCEVVTLAAKSLAVIDNDFVLNISHIGIIEALFEECEIDRSLESAILRLIESKSADGFKNFCSDNGIDDSKYQKLLCLFKTYKSPADAVETINSVATSKELKNALGELKMICDIVTSRGFEGKISVDFSAVGGMNYYSGIVLSGYIKGIPTAVLSGGRYDRLMKKMGRKSGAIGFAVYLDSLERFKRADKEFDVDTVLINGGNIDAALSTSEMLSEGGNSVLVCKEMPKDITCRRILKLTEKGLETVYGND